MTEPLVCGILLTADRPAMTARAIASFEAQTYSNKALVILDSGREKLNLRSGIKKIYATVEPGPTIGELRNLANGMCQGADIIAHWDSDDWSHPERLTEQVSALDIHRSAGNALAPGIPRAAVECVGYNDMLFWDSRGNGEAWFYFHGGRNYALGTSMCYWREAWKRNPFAHTSRGEDKLWSYKVRVRGCTSMAFLSDNRDRRPRMIAEIHGGNTGTHITHDHDQWRRAPEFDKYCRERMEVQHATL